MQVKPNKCLISLVLAFLLAITPLHTALVAFPEPDTPHQISDIHKNRELQCLAKNIYFESRNQPLEGKIAVAQVTLNRVQHQTAFKSTICGVVYESKQFSWTESKVFVKDTKAWEEAVLIANAVVAGTLRLKDFDALYFHTKQVFPRWRKSKKLVRVIQDHIFYA